MYYFQVSYLVPQRTDSQNVIFQHFLIHLKTPFDFSTPYVRPICMEDLESSKNWNPYGWNLIIGGFTEPRGLDRGLQLSTHLLYPETKEECERAYELYYNANLSSSLICGRIYTGMQII